jgi:hypothetical protein
MARHGILLLLMKARHLRTNAAPVIRGYAAFAPAALLKRSRAIAAYCGLSR